MERVNGNEGEKEPEEATDMHKRERWGERWNQGRLEKGKGKGERQGKGSGYGVRVRLGSGSGRRNAPAPKDMSARVNLRKGGSDFHRAGSRMERAMKTIAPPVDSEIRVVHGLQGPQLDRVRARFQTIIFARDGFY